VRDILFTAVLLGTLPVCLVNPYFGILAYVWVGLMNPHRFVYQLSHFPVALAFAVATVFGMVIRARYGRFPVRTETLLILVLFCYTTVTSMLALGPDAWSEWDSLGKILLMSVVAAMLLQTRVRLNQLVFTMMASIAFFGVKGGLFSILTKGNYEVFGPPGSFIEGNNELALAELMVLPLVIYFIRQETVGWRRLALKATFVLTTVSIIFSYSRGAFVAFGGLALVMAWRSRYRFRALTAAAVVGTLVVLFAPTAWTTRMQTIQTYQKDPSAMGRINAWYFAWNLASSRPIGGGFHAFTPELFLRYAPNPSDYHDAHSIYFEVLGEHGFPGLAIFLSLMAASLLRLQRLRMVTKREPEWKWVRDLAEMLQCSIVAYALAGAFLGLAYFDLYYYIVIAGVLLHVVYVTEKRTAAVAAVAPEPEPESEPAWRGVPAPRPA